MNESNNPIYDYTQDQVKADFELAHSYTDELLEASSMQQVCDAYATIDTTIKTRIDERKARTKPLKDQVGEIERPYRPVIKALEETKDRIHDEISKRFIEKETILSTRIGELEISQSRPKREFEVFDMRQVPLEFLKIDEELVEAFVDLNGQAPSGILMHEKKQCRIVHKK